MAKKTPTAPRYFIVEEIGAETGHGVDDHGRAVMPTIRLDIKGRWTHGQEQTIPLILATDGARELAALLDRTIIEAFDQNPSPEEAAANAELLEHLATVTGKTVDEAAGMLADPVSGASTLITPDTDPAV